MKGEGLRVEQSLLSKTENMHLRFGHIDAMTEVVLPQVETDEEAVATMVAMRARTLIMIVRARSMCAMAVAAMVLDIDTHRTGSHQKSNDTERSTLAVLG